MVSNRTAFNRALRVHIGLLIIIWYSGAVAAEPDDAPVGPPPQAPEAGQAPVEEGEYDPCRALNGDSEVWLDRTQEFVYQTICGTGMWFDGFFGDTRNEQRSGDTFGRLGLSTFWDERDGMDLRLRMRARFPLPAARNRGALLLGRGDEKELVEERTTTDFDTLPGSFNDVNDDAWLLGLGFDRGGLRRGFRFSIGAKLGLPPEPYVKGTYRRSVTLSSRDLVRFREILFWRDGEGFGSTTQLDLDHLLSDRLMLRWGNTGTVSENIDIEGLEWGSSLTLYQGLSNRGALSYRTLVRGETKADVRLQNYGLELRYRRRIYREWLFLDVLTSVTWPREFLIEERETNFGVGIGVEMFFGPVPDALLR